MRRSPALLLTIAVLTAAAAPADEQQRMAEERMTAASRLRAVEDQVAALAQQVEALEQRRDAAERGIQQLAVSLGPMLPLAERLALYPVETLLAAPVPAPDAVRGLLVMRGLAATLQREAADLLAEEQAAAAAQRDLEAELPRLRAAEAAHAVQAAQLDRQIAMARAARPRLDDPAAETARRAAAEAARAETLRGALLAMGAARERTPQPASAAFVLPVAGAVVRRWGESTEAGPATGISFRAPPSGRVVAPCAGRVAFAGPFRSFGKLIILDCGAGTHIVLAGLDRLDVAVGEAVQATEPVGVMPDWDPASPPPHPALYVELRRDGQAVDPAPFLRVRS